MKYCDLDPYFKKQAQNLERNFVIQVFKEMNVQENEDTINQMVNERLNSESYIIKKNELGIMELVREY